MVKTISKESKDLAIEFADWLKSNCDVNCGSEFITWQYVLNDNLYHSDELFNKFLEEKYNGEIQDI